MENLVLVGIRTGGVYLSEGYKRKYSGIMKGGENSLGILDVNLYRDDISHPTKSSLWGKQK